MRNITPYQNMTLIDEVAIYDNNMIAYLSSVLPVSISIKAYYIINA